MSKNAVINGYLNVSQALNPRNWPLDLPFTTSIYSISDSPGPLVTALS